MTVYVDEARYPLGRMLMCHMVADTDRELMAMAAAVGVPGRHIQEAGTWKVHFDVCQAKRTLAIALGAVAVPRRVLGAMRMRRKVTGELGPPEEAQDWLKAHIKGGLAR